MCTRTYSVAACNRRNWIAAGPRFYNFAESTGTSPQFDNSGTLVSQGLNRRPADVALIEPFISEIGFYERGARISEFRDNSQTI